jgi:hypothetical protein
MKSVAITVLLVALAAVANAGYDRPAYGGNSSYAQSSSYSYRDVTIVDATNGQGAIVLEYAIQLEVNNQ